jgi:acetyl esterase
VVLYLHGGGFRILSKDTHWAMSLPFAKQGYLVATIDYRLAPKEPFPAAIEDACTALAWVHDNIRAHGGDPSRIVVAGESAGANLTCAVVLTSVVQRPEPWARAVYDREIALRAAVPACGVLQVSDPERFLRRKPGLPAFLNDRLLEVRDAYLTPCTITHDGGRDLADPLCVIESLTSPLARALPPMFAGVGTGDPLLDDTRRLGAALDRLGVKNRTRYYPGEMHAFQAMPWSRHAPAYWAELWEFLAEHVGSARATDADASASIAR